MQPIACIRGYKTFEANRRGSEPPWIDPGCMWGPLPNLRQFDVIRLILRLKMVCNEIIGER